MLMFMHSRIKGSMYLLGAELSHLSPRSLEIELPKELETPYSVECRL